MADVAELGGPNTGLSAMATKGWPGARLTHTAALWSAPLPAEPTTTSRWPQLVTASASSGRAAARVGQHRFRPVEGVRRAPDRRSRQPARAELGAGDQPLAPFAGLDQGGQRAACAPSELEVDVRVPLPAVGQGGRRRDRCLAVVAGAGLVVAWPPVVAPPGRVESSVPSCLEDSAVVLEAGRRAVDRPEVLGTARSSRTARCQRTAMRGRDSVDVVVGQRGRRRRSDVVGTSVDVVAACSSPARRRAQARAQLLGASAPGQDGGQYPGDCQRRPGPSRARMPEVLGWWSEGTAGERSSGRSS